MRPSRVRAKLQWSLMKLAVRALGMRGDTTREIRGFPGIVARHASKADHAAYLRLMTDPNPDWLTVPNELAALALRSPGCREDFDAAEARRFETYDRSKLVNFEKRVADIVAKALLVRDTQFRMAQIDRLRGLETAIPENDPGDGPRWRNAGQALLAAAIEQIESYIREDAVAARLDAIASTTTRTDKTIARMVPHLEGVPPLVQKAAEALADPVRAADEVRRAVDLTPEEVRVREAFLLHGSGRRVASALGMSPAMVSRRKASLIRKFVAAGIPAKAVFNQRPPAGHRIGPEGSIASPEEDWREDREAKFQTIRQFLSATPAEKDAYRKAYPDIDAEAKRWARMKSK